MIHSFRARHSATAVGIASAFLTVTLSIGLVALRASHAGEPAGTECQVRFSVVDAVDLATLQFVVAYGDAAGAFDGVSTDVECSTGLPSTIAIFEDRDGQRELEAALVGFRSFRGPAKVVTCRFTATAPVGAGDFATTVLEASDPSVTPVVPDPTIAVSVSCEGNPTTTSTTTSTSHTTTTTTLDGNACLVALRLEDAATLGSLQVEVSALGGAGHFLTTGDEPDCFDFPAGVFAATNLADGDETMVLALIGLGGFDGPVDLAVCSFVATPTASPASFQVIVTDAGTPEANPVTGLTVTLQTDACHPAICGDGIVTAPETCDDAGASATCNANCTTVTTSTTTSTSLTTTSITSTTTTSTSTTTTTTLGDNACLVTLHLQDAVALGSMEFRITALGDAGHFVGTGAGPDCFGFPTGAITALSLTNADRTLAMAVVTLGGLTGPIDLADCSFVATPSADPADFEVLVTDAADPSGTPLRGLTVTVQAESCHVDYCGDGVVTDPETCDDAGQSATCDANCTSAFCGDGTVNAAAGETCDTTGQSASCDADCTAVSCGDGTVNAAAGETCDTAGQSASCDADCTAVSCGDSTVNETAGETCDAGGDAVDCDGDCSGVRCGDGYENGAAGEGCDEGGANSNSNGVFCNAACAPTPCGTPVSRSHLRPNATDALWALQSSIALQTCDRRVCDTDASGSTSASDALRILNAAVQRPVSLICPTTP